MVCSDVTKLTLSDFNDTGTSWLLQTKLQKGELSEVDIHTSITGSKSLE